MKTLNESLIALFHSVPKYIYIPEKRGRKPGSSLNGDRRVESMGGIAAGASGEGRRGRHGACEAVLGVAVGSPWREGRNV